jgi:hypothetical protein
MAWRQTVLSGGISFIGATACAFIANELWADMTVGTKYFDQIPKPVKPAAMAFFAFWCILETRKVHSRVLDLIDHPETPLTS